MPVCWWQGDITDKLRCKASQMCLRGFVEMYNSSMAVSWFVYVKVCLGYNRWAVGGVSLTLFSVFHMYLKGDGCVVKGYTWKSDCFSFVKIPCEFFLLTK